MVRGREIRFDRPLRERPDRSHRPLHRHAAPPTPAAVALAEGDHVPGYRSVLRTRLFWRVLTMVMLIPLALGLVAIRHALAATPPDPTAALHDSSHAYRHGVLPLRGAAPTGPAAAATVSPLTYHGGVVGVGVTT